MRRQARLVRHQAKAARVGTHEQGDGDPCCHQRETKPMKVRASGILLGVAMLAPVFQVFATDLGAAGRTWHVIKEDASEMVVVGRDQSGVGRFPSVLVATIHAAPKVSIEQIGIRYDYDVALVDLDCDTEGRHRYAEKHSYRLGQGTAVSSDTADSGWRGPTLSPFTGELIKVGEEWSIGCNAGSVGIPLRPAQNYDAMTLAYRQRLDDGSYRLRTEK